jgi:quercetin dioxygenase-like cupin family protein
VKRSMKRNVAVAAITLAIGMALAGFALATPGSGSASIEYGRHTMPHFAAKFANRDIVVGENVFSPGGQSGWHSHPGKVIIAVQRGAITIFRSDDPSCSGTTYAAGDIFIERPGVVHNGVNAGTVAAVVNVTYLNVPIGTSPRIDEPQPANCL